MSPSPDEAEGKLLFLMVSEDSPLFRACFMLTILALGAPAPARLALIRQAPFTVLNDSAGRAFDLARLHGKVVLVSFIYTTCNGVCPATTQTLVGVERALQDARLWENSVEFVSITLDPKRDTPEILKRYARLFGADLTAWHFLTGEPARVESVIKAWGMWVKMDPTGVIDHPSRIFLLDQKGRQREIYNLDFLKVGSVMDDIRELLADK
jgi:protein SCO1/2